MTPLDAERGARLPVRIVPRAEGARVETGPLQFGDDWPGTFIRGDNAFGYRLALQRVLSGASDPIARAQVEGLARLLAACDARASLLSDHREG